MNCSELMIGDWIFSTRHNSLLKVTTLLPDFLWAAAAEDVDNKAEVSDGLVLFYHEAKPVHLTLPILKRNGFALNFSFSDSIDYVCAIGDSFGSKLFLRLFKRRPRVEFRFFSHRRSDFMDNIVIGDTVHELQHAMRLCDIHKDIVL